jgi:hypothetical protein
MSLESTLESAVVRYCKTWGVLTYKFVSPSNRGVPDRIFIGAHGDVAFLELKAPGKEPTPLQLHNIEKFRARGVAIDHADNLAACQNFIHANVINGPKARKSER